MVFVTHALMEFLMMPCRSTISVHVQSAQNRKFSEKKKTHIDQKIAWKIAFWWCFTDAYETPSRNRAFRNKRLNFSFHCNFNNLHNIIFNYFIASNWCCFCCFVILTGNFDECVRNDTEDIFGWVSLMSVIPGIWASVYALPLLSFNGAGGILYGGLSVFNVDFNVNSDSATVR